MTRAAHLRAFVPLCEINWRSVWFWRGCVFARYGRGLTRIAILLFLGYILRVTVIPEYTSRSYLGQSMVIATF